MYFNTMGNIKKKLVEGKPITMVRPCARGFKVIQDFRTDSPCCSRIGIQSALSILTSNKWRLKSAHVKTALLQGKKIRERSLHTTTEKSQHQQNLEASEMCLWSSRR